jgi:hypothetical protein
VYARGRIRCAADLVNARVCTATKLECKQLSRVSPLSSNPASAMWRMPGCVDGLHLADDALASHRCKASSICIPPVSDGPKHEHNTHKTGRVTKRHNTNIILWCIATEPGGGGPRYSTGGRSSSETMFVCSHWTWEQSQTLLEHPSGGLRIVLLLPLHVRTCRLPCFAPGNDGALAAGRHHYSRAALATAWIRIGRGSTEPRQGSVGGGWVGSDA